MLKKSVAFLTLTAVFIVFAFFVSTALAQENELRKAYDWLFEKTKTRALWDNLNIKQHVFSMLALSCDENSLNISNQSLYGKAWKSPYVLCWGEKKANYETDCKITETALAKLAADKLALLDTKRATNWLLNKSMFFKDIYWFLELDVPRDREAECRISYDGTNTTVFINKNKTLSNLSSTACFIIYDNYWLQIKSDCYEKSFKIRCNVENDESFRITLKYKKYPNSSIWYLSPDSKVVESRHVEEIALESYCLGLGSCDYEGTAWAAYALKGTDEAKKFIPYLIIAKEDNKQYLPAALLYLVGVTRYKTEIERFQNPQGFWMALPTTVYGQFYDTALAGLTGLGNLSSSKGGARYYLTVDCDARTFVATSDNKYRYWKCTEYGCDEIRDTAFLLWTFWPEFCLSEVNITITNVTCEAYGFNCRDYCLPDEIENISLTATCDFGEVCCMKLVAPVGCEEVRGYCIEDYCPSGEFKLNATCTNWWETCCKKYSDAKCYEFGTECDVDEKCNVDTVKDIDEVDCCPGECVPKNATKSCYDLYGDECDIDQVCIDESTWLKADFAPASDTTRCCVGKCVEDVTCAGKGGKVCGTKERCSTTTVETSDQQYCCTGICEPKSCAEIGGEECKENEKCTNWLDESINCCKKNNCEKKAARWWLWLLIIVIIVAGALLYFYKFRKPKKKPTAPAMMPTLRRPLMPTTPAQPRAVFKPIPIPTRAPVTPSVAQAPTRPAKAAPSKTEAELAKTLKKLKSMTKK